MKALEADVIVVGAGLAGLAATFELLNKKRKVLLIDRDTFENRGGLAIKSFGGILMVGTPEQKRSRIPDTPELAFSDWVSHGSLTPESHWPWEWAQDYCHNSLEQIYHWCTSIGVKFLPVVNWPERGLFKPGNSVPRWHITWGTGHWLVSHLLQQLDHHPNAHLLTSCFHSRVEELMHTSGRVCGVRGHQESTGVPFEATAGAVVLASGGMCGGDLSEVKAHWHATWGPPPRELLNGSHRYSDGLLRRAAEGMGAKSSNLDCQFHYPAGIPHPTPQFPNQGLSLVPPRSALWMDATGRRFGPVPLVSYTDTRHLVETIARSGHSHSWQILNHRIARKELAVSGSDYMTAFRNRQKLRLLTDLIWGNTSLVKRLLNESDAFVVAPTLEELAEKISGQTSPDARFDTTGFLQDIRSYDAEIRRGPRFHRDEQLLRIAATRRYKGDRMRTCAFQTIEDPKERPYIAIRLRILTRKSLGGLVTNLKSQVLQGTQAEARPIDGLYAAGEAAGFGGGGVHGRSSLEGSFLGGAILTGRRAAQIL